MLPDPKLSQIVKKCCLTPNCCVWDAENRLIEVRTASVALAAGAPYQRYRHRYDSQWRRIQTTVESWDAVNQSWNLQSSERYLHDEWNVVAVVDDSGDLLRRYAWGNDISGSAQGAGGVGGLLAAWEADSNRAWCYAYDGNGNVSAVVDLADNTKVGRYDYDAFGRTIAKWGDEELVEVNVDRFSTKPVDGTGLYYYGFRYYNPETGRWLNRDPIAERGGVNLYAFVGNDAVNDGDYLGAAKLSKMGGYPSLVIIIELRRDHRQHNPTNKTTVYYPGHVELAFRKDDTNTIGGGIYLNGNVITKPHQTRIYQCNCTGDAVKAMHGRYEQYRQFTRELNEAAQAGRGEPTPPMNPNSPHNPDCGAWSNWVIGGSCGIPNWDNKDEENPENGYDPNMFGTGPYFLERDLINADVCNLDHDGLAELRGMFSEWTVSYPFD